MRQITYAIHRDDGMVYSRVGREVAYPVLQFDRIGVGGDFTKPLQYELEKSSALSLCYEWPRLRWTKKVPTAIKNRHRAFWGMAPLREGV